MSENVRRRRFELRAAPELGEGVVRGIVTTFDDPYPIGRQRREVIKRDTFDLSQPIPLFYEHNWMAGPIGVSRSLKATAAGLEAEFELFVEDDPRARSIWRAMKAKALREFSIGFMPADDAITETRSAEGVVTETIDKGDLVEVSSVVRGANPNTETVSTRAVLPAPAAGAVDPAAAAAAGVEFQEDKPTKATLLTKAAELVEMAVELHMAEQLPDVIKQAIKLLVEQAPAAPQPPVQPGAPAAPVAPAPPVQRSIPDDLSPALFRALSTSAERRAD